MQENTSGCFFSEHRYYQLAGMAVAAGVRVARPTVAGHCRAVTPTVRRTIATSDGHFLLAGSDAVPSVDPVDSKSRRHQLGYVQCRLHPLVVHQRLVHTTPQ